MKKTLITILATVLICCLAVGGTLAWLTASTESIENTFTVGDINITLEESPNLDLMIVPGTTITKDPVVTVDGGSEACWLFVKIEKANWSDKLTYSLDGWTELPGETDVFYRSVLYSDNDQKFHVIAGDIITVSQDLAKGELTAAPVMTLTAYAVQSEGVADAATAWGHLPTT